MIFISNIYIRKTFSNTDLRAVSQSTRLSSKCFHSFSTILETRPVPNDSAPRLAVKLMCQNLQQRYQTYPSVKTACSAARPSAPIIGLYCALNTCATWVDTFLQTLPGWSLSFYKGYFSPDKNHFDLILMLQTHRLSIYTRGKWRGDNINNCKFTLNLNTVNSSELKGK